MSEVSRPAVTVRRARDADELAAAMELRVRVFCDEQGVDNEEELDDHDQQAIQLVAVDEAGVVATCRLRAIGGDRKLERMAVERRLRGQRVGAALLAQAEQEARSAGAARVVLHAQTRAEPFYAANGYEAEGERFFEAKIEHIRMSKRL